MRSAKLWLPSPESRSEMAEYYGTPARPPRLSQLWPLVAARLAGDLTLTRLLGGPGRVHVVTDAYPAVPEGSSPEVGWARLVVVPVVRNFALNTVGPGRELLATWLMRCEVRPPLGTSYDPGRLHDSVQEATLMSLQGWIPEATAHCEFRLPVYQEAPHQPPLWDEGSGLWLTSSEYRVLAFPRSTP